MTSLSSEDEILIGLRRHASKFHSHASKSHVLQKYSKHAADPAKGGLRRCTAHVAAWLAFAPSGPCAVIGSDPDLQPAALLARLLKGLRAPGPRLQVALALIKGRPEACCCVGHKTLKLVLQRLGKEQIPMLPAIDGHEGEDQRIVIADAAISVASSTKLAQRLARRFHHDALTF